LHSKRVDQEVVERVRSRQRGSQGLVLGVDELDEVGRAALVEVGDQLQVSRGGLGAVARQLDIGVRKAGLMQSGPHVLFEPLCDHRAVRV
jgi:hypothetical protein